MIYFLANMFVFKIVKVSKGVSLNVDTWNVLK